MMVTEKIKANRIVKEIMSYFLANHIYDFDMHFHIDEQELRIEYLARLEAEPESFQGFLKDLSVPRQLELEECFNSLLGAHGHVHDYSFLGKSIFDVEGEFKDGQLRLFIKRYIVY